MARPRIFISSTFYDLRQVRADIERSIRELGYEPIQHEAGRIPYSKNEPLEAGAYREIELSDIIIFITGGKYGTQSTEDPSYSISQVELRRALEKGIQVFIFVESAVFSEYNTYKLNKDSDTIQYSSVNDTKVFTFLEELYSLPNNNPITKFEVADDITNFLKEQFAGLFQRFLQDQKRQKELHVLDEINSVAKTLKELVGYLTDERENKDDAIKNIILSNHPIFRQLAELTSTPYRVFFTTRQEMTAWFKARNYTPVAESYLDSGSVEEWHHDRGRNRDNVYIKFTKHIFDENDRLIPFTENEWDNNIIRSVTMPPASTSTPRDDDIPF